LIDSYGKASDKTFGLNTRGREFFIGNAEVDFEGEDLIIGDEMYEGTRGLWDLITKKNPVIGLASEEDMKNYEKIMVETGAMRYRKNPDRPAERKSEKWKKYIRPIWEKYVQRPKQKAKCELKKGSGFLPSDPHAL